LEEIKLRHGQKGLLEDNKQLKEYNEFGRTLSLFVEFKVHGGAFQDNNNNSNHTYYNFKITPKYRERIIDKKKYYKILNFSNDECCIALIKDNNNNIKMSCGHTINSNSMFDYLRKIKNSSNLGCKIICPVEKCSTQWSFEICSIVACLDDDEYLEFDQEFQKRALPDMKSCPNCLNNCSKPDNLTYNRVSCSACHKQDWCWQCGQIWKGANFVICGNYDCITFNQDTESIHDIKIGNCNSHELNDTNNLNNMVVSLNANKNNCDMNNNTIEQVGIEQSIVKKYDEENKKK